MAEFEATLSAMTEASGSMKNLIQQYKEEAAAVLQSTQALGESWTGDASQTFEQLVQQFKKWCDEMAAILDTYPQVLEQSRNQYDETDRAAAGNFPG